MLATEIKKLIDEEGGSLTLGRVTSGAYSPSTSSATVTPASTTVTGLILEYRAFERDGTHILAGDKKAVLKGDVSPAPKVDDTITKGGKSHKIVNVRTIENKGAVVVYVCQIRG
jgi:hypothetical protein